MSILSSVRSAPARLLSLAALSAVMFLLPPPLQPQEREEIIVPVGSVWPGQRPWQIDISDDGRYVVYQTNRGNGWNLYIHDLQTSVTREVPGLGDTPYVGSVSPDGQWLLFRKRLKTWKAPLSGGELTVLNEFNWWNTWESNETILISKVAGGIWRVQADRSQEETQVAAVDTTTGATDYHRPFLLPGGKGVLVSVGFGTGVDLRRIGVISFPGGQLTLLDEHGVNPRWAESGHILFANGSRLKAIPFDLEALEVRGPAATVLEGVQVNAGGAAHFDISRTGVMVYVPGQSEIGRVWPRTLVWVDRAGLETPFDTPAEKLFLQVRLSPDKRYLAAWVEWSGIHLFDRSSGGWTALIEDGGAARGLFWSRDGNTLFYTRRGQAGGFVRQALAPGSDWEEILPEKDNSRFYGTSLDSSGTRVIGMNFNPQSMQHRLGSVPLDEPAVEGLLEDSGEYRYAAVGSPDGQWLAYVERTSGLDRVYVERMAGGGGRVLVSEGAIGEAAEPVWGRSSEELFYRDAAHLVSVQLEMAPTLRVRSATPLFKVRPYQRIADPMVAAYDYDPTTDRFLMARWSLPDRPAANLHVIPNGFDLLNRLAPRR